MPSSSLLIRLPALSVVDLVGADATAILHNLTTNDVKKLTSESPNRFGLETFITNVRGKCLGHVVAFATENGYRMIGSPGVIATADSVSSMRQSQAIAEHADRYTIREDAAPVIRDEDLAAWMVIDGNEEPAQTTPSPRMTTQDGIDSYRLPWVKSGTLFLLPVETAPEHPSVIAERLGVESDSLVAGDENDFHAHRLAAGFPWFGIDLTDAHLPQEADRETQTISFTKGCYLGQETVARLDALGQVQKKLVRWKLSGLPAGTQPEADDKLRAQDAAADAKPVGRITSVGRINDQGEGLAMGYARRSHFEAGSVLAGSRLAEDVGEVTYTAEVLPPVRGESPE
ncbi:Folate-dependent protein for Fe/S cluster synthesis/repair in oxidative stress [Rhodopirellula islandica]|uniref:Folate-dependent protein for Fe/S cluster synthesis/repair in oxidative stress n=1 Tax=Rhodopirellula islandica TaxID=595434 RepID=A0A0J1B471_RHOIS|nr:aminomethyltransferase [Rhodopirellula islandica]KLU01650.1 Folate-dependent protein for Fe/S cluster synthesis/repair in oxidative stress [Rhodopirellula islandica]